LPTSWSGHAVAPEAAAAQTAGEVGRLFPGGKFDINRLWLDRELKLIDCEPYFLGIASDNAQSIAALINRARGLDVIVSTGGAGVWDNDFMTAAFDAMGAFNLAWQTTDCGSLALAALGITPIIGLCGSPAVASEQFSEIVKPLLLKMSGKYNQND
jgi:molybdopterin molybdotransferase